ncbi:MAG: MFS transporter [Pyrinomonadaceae bacterium]|nr:MFS transporter [Pyrinomonadaceae bacterium]MCX7639234.1 MFS transporter [Pyrinomonadaceae bacterium]MDW8303544.1 MFS transporter [Acidobacteriota bacterium]
MGNEPFEKTDENFLSRPLLIIFLTVLIDLIGFGIVIPLLAFYAEEFEATPLDIGLLVASYSFMQFIFAPILGGISDRYGRRPVLLLSIAGSCVGYLMLGLANSLWMIYVSRILGGITAANLSTAQAYIADVTTERNRAKGMGLFGMAFGLGFILGPAIAGVLSKFGHHIPFLFASLLSFINVVLIFFILPESLKSNGLVRNRESRFKEILRALRDSRFSVLTIEYFLLVTAFSMMTTAFAYYTMTNFGYDASQTGYLLGYIGLIAVVTQGFLLDRLVKLYGEEKLIIAGSLILSLSLFSVPLVSKDSGGLISLLLGTAVFSFGNSISSPSLNSLASKLVGENEQGRALGLMQSAASLARVVGPFLCGILLNNAFDEVDDFTLKRTFWTAGFIMLLAFFVSIYYSLMRKNT